jgi:hypothetical protein
MAKITIELNDRSLGLAVAALRTIGKLPATLPKDIENAVECLNTAAYLEDPANWLVVSE